MEQTKFRCKIEEVPVIAGFILQSLTADLAVFTDYSPVFDEAYVQNIRAKLNYCLELERSDIKIQQLKTVTAQLVGMERGLRPLLNKLEGYVKMAADGLDVPADSFGVGVVRNAIARGNDEGILASLQTLQKNIGRNQAALQAKGLKPDVAESLAAAAVEIDRLNNEQNSLMNERNQTTAANVKDYNELWSLITPVCDAARSLFRGVDEVKLKQYTIAALIARVNAEGTQTEPVASDKATK